MDTLSTSPHRRMRVIHLMQSASRVYGAERCIMLELSTLRARGHDAQVLVLRETRQGPEGGALTEALRALGIPVTEVATRSQISPRLLFDLTQALRRLLRPGPIVLHTHGLKTDLLGYLVTRPLRVPLLCEVHGWLRPEHDRLVQIYEALDRQVLRRAEGVIALSRAYRDELVGLGARVSLLPSGIDVAGLQAAPPRRDLRAELGLSRATLCGIVARLSPEKGHADFLHALRAARAALPQDPPVGLVIGEGPLLADLQAQARALGLGADALRFTGYVAEVADAYRALDVLVSCSRVEGLPLNLIEAMALGRTVLSYDTGGCADIVVPLGAGSKEGEPTGVLVPRVDREGRSGSAAVGREALAAGLIKLCQDPALRQRLGAAAARRAQERYSLSSWVEGAEAVYADLLGLRGAA